MWSSGASLLGAQDFNEQPTSFVLPPEAVDRLRAAAGRIVLESPDFQRYLKDLGDRVVKTQVLP